jgi:hypothetical protein
MLDFDHFASGDASADAGPHDASMRDAPAADAPGVDAPGVDAPGTPRHTLTVMVTGTGMVASTPTGISCGAMCSADFDDGAMVMLTASPDATTSFVSWGGACTGSALTCTVTISAATSVQATFAPRGSVRWARQVSFTGQDSFENDIVIAPDGNPILGTVVDDGDGSDLFVAKMDQATGAILWMQHLDTPTGEDFGGIAVDDMGNVYATVEISGFGMSYVAGGTTFTGDLFGNIATYRLNGSTGAIEWGVQWGGSGQDRPHGIAVAGNNLFVTGETSSTTSSFGGPFTIAGSIGTGFLVRVSTQTGGTNRVTALSGNFIITGVAANATNAAVVGSVSAAATIGPCGFHPSGAGNDMFIASFLSSDLSCVWARTAGDSTSNVQAGATSVATQPDGGFVTTGYFAGNVLFATSGTSLASHGMSDIFAVRYGADGTHIWSFRYGGTGSDAGTSIATMPTGETFLTGVFTGSALFGTHTVMGPSSVFVTRMTSGATPTHDWAVALGGDGPDRSDGLGVDAAGNSYVSAYFTGMTSVGGMAFTGADYDTWVAALVR